MKGLADNNLTPPKLDEVQTSLISFFVDGVKILGLPPSVGGIYGVLFATREPLSLDDLVDRLDISKGSASQGLKMLRQIGAVNEVPDEGGRKTFFYAEQRLKSLVGGFIKEEVRPHLDSGKNKIKCLKEQLADVDDPEQKAFYDAQIKQVKKWLDSAQFVLPVLQRIMGE